MANSVPFARHPARRAEAEGDAMTKTLLYAMGVLFSVICFCLGAAIAIDLVMTFDLEEALVNAGWVMAKWVAVFGLIWVAIRVWW